MFNATILDHFEKPRNAGELAPPAFAVEITNPVCGDILRLWMLADAERIQQISFKARGCVAAIASGSVLTEMVLNKRLQEAKAISAQDIAAALGGLPPESGHAAELAADALKIALHRALAQSA